MQYVTDTNNQVHSFPDEATPEMISQALGLSNAPTPQQTVSSAPEMASPLRLPALVASEAAKGLATTLGLPGDLQQLATQHVYNPIAKAAGGQEIPADATANLSLGERLLSGSLPTSAELLALTGKAGLTQRADLLPQSEAERLIAGAASGLGSSVPLVGIGKPLVTLAQGLVGGLAGEGAHELAPDVSAGPLIAGALSGAGVQGLRNLVAGDPIKRIAGQLGTSQSLQEGGLALQEAARDWKSGVMPAKEAAAWAPVDAAIPGVTPTPLANLDQTLQQMAGKGSTVKPLLGQIESQLPKRLNVGMGAMNLAGGAPTWEDVRSLRSSIGDMMRNPKLAQDMSQDDLDRIYKAVTDDLRTTARSQGAEDLFQAANEESTRLHAFEKNVLGNVITGSNIAQESLRPEDVAGRLLGRSKRGATDLQALRGEMPDAVDELAAAHLNYNPGGWKNLSPEAKQALVADPEARATIDSATIKKPGPLVAGIGHLQGLGLGSELGTVAGHMLGYPELFGGALGGIAGFFAPKLGQLGEALVRPNMLGAELVGGEAGRAAGQGR